MLEMFVNSVTFAVLGKATAVPVEAVETDYVEKVANIVIVSEASVVEEVVLVAGNFVAAVMVPEIVVVEEAISGTDLALEELFGAGAAVVRIPCSVVVWGTVADAVVALVIVARTAAIAVEAVIIVGPGVAVVVGTVKFVGNSVVVEAGVDAAFVALLVAHFEAEGAVEVAFGLV